MGAAITPYILPTPIPVANVPVLTADKYPFALGVAQTWKAIADEVQNTYYQNTLGVPIIARASIIMAGACNLKMYVATSAGGANSQVVDNVQCLAGEAAKSFSLSGVVPIGGFYMWEFTTSGGTLTSITVCRTLKP